MIDNCKHNSFQTNSRVGRLTNDEGEVTSYVLEIEVHCTECMMPFRFLGLRGGMIIGTPTVSAEELEARLPIEPI